MANIKPRIRIPKINLFLYSCHRKYLADCFAALRGENPKLSYQRLMDELQLTSKSQVFRLLKALPFVLSKELVYRLSAYLGHSRREAEYFQLLVAFGESDSETDRMFFFQQLQKVARPIARSRFSRSDFEYFSEWYLPIIREIVTCPGPVRNAAEIGALVKPPVSEAKVREAIDVLLRLRVIHTEDGAYRQSQVAIVPDPDFRSLMIRSYQIRHLQLAEESLKYSSVHEQHLGAITFGVNEEGLQRIRAKLSEFISEVISIASQYENSYDQVMQMNLQLFPVSAKLNS